LLSARVFCEDTTWALAAEAFTPVNLPASYEGIAPALPSLLLAEIENVNKRSILPEEQKSRVLSVLSAERLKLVTERSALILDRDKVYLSDQGTLKKKKNRYDVNKKIIAKEKEIEKLDVKIRVAVETAYIESTTLTVTLWESGSRLYERSKDVSLAKSLMDSKISGLITGTVEDLSGYLLVTASIETGVAGLPVITVKEAAPYDEIDYLVSTLTARLLPGLSQVSPVSISVNVVPENSIVFLDSRQIYDISNPVTVFSGEHTVSVSCEGYRSATRTFDFSGSDKFGVDITLIKEPLVSVAFTSGVDSESVFLHTQSVGQLPLTTEIPALRTIGETENGTVKTFFIFDPDMTDNPSSLESIIHTNKTVTKNKIESARKWFYGSLGVLYLSLPVYMISKGIMNDKYTAYQDGRIPQTQESVDEINGLIRFSTISGYVSLGLGVNVAFQLFRYILSAEQAVPKETKNKVIENGDN
jgi:hypothetical protein